MEKEREKDVLEILKEENQRLKKENESMKKETPSYPPVRGRLVTFSSLVKSEKSR
ncbi:MAG: hypothetical protein MSA80_03615 [Prevotella sp.]|nr:hypothetical protein [Prevotella sp.]